MQSKDAVSNKKTPKVSVCVITYNQAQYVEECLNSLVEQITDFDFEIIVGDDCSTDGTRSIIEQFARRHPEKIQAILHEKNLGAVHNYKSVHLAARGEYIAHLDGDDYAFPGKLQAQADYLDNHIEAAVVWHRMKVLDQGSGRFADDLMDVDLLPKDGIDQKFLLEIGSIACHSSKMHRRSAESFQYPAGDFLDYLVDVENLAFGHAGYLKEIYGVYRANVGVTKDDTKTRSLSLEHLLYFSEKYPSLKRYISAHALRIFLSDLRHQGKTLRLSFKVAVRTFDIRGCVRYLYTRKYMKMLRSPLSV